MSFRCTLVAEMRLPCGMCNSIQGNRIKNFEKIQVANFQMIAFRRLYSKIKNALKTMIDNQALTF